MHLTFDPEVVERSLTVIDMQDIHPDNIPPIYYCTVLSSALQKCSAPLKVLFSSFRGIQRLLSVKYLFGEAHVA